MLNGINQTSPYLLPVIQSYGCLFLCFAESSPIIFEGKEGCDTLNHIWQQAEKEGIITPDLNKDGDYDDDGEAEIQNHTLLANKYFKLDVRYDNVHHSADEDIPDDVVLVFGKYVWRSSHFVVLNKTKDVTFDSFGMSNTVKYATEFAEKYGVVTVLKSANTIVASPDKSGVYVNSTGNSGLSKGGSGDVLAGIIGGMAAQSFRLSDAVNSAVYIHGFAADCVAEKTSKSGMLPSDVIAELRDTYSNFEK